MAHCKVSKWVEWELALVVYARIGHGNAYIQQHEWVSTSKHKWWGAKKGRVHKRKRTSTQGVSVIPVGQTAIYNSKARVILYKGKRDTTKQ